MTKKLGVVLIFGGISFVFVFMGYNTFGPTTSGYAAVVNNSIITLHEHQDLSNRMINFYSQTFGGSFDMSETQIREIRLNALEQLIGEMAVGQKASEEGLVVLPEMIRDEIMSIPAFWSGDRFDRSRYEQYLLSSRLSPAKFEEKISRALTVEMTNDLIRNSTGLTKKEIQKLWILKNTKLNMEFVRINRDSLKLKMNASDNEVDSFLLSNTEAISNYYKNNPDKFLRGEQIRAQHILISISESITDGDALKLANNVLERTKNEDFSELAKSMSDDPGAAANGGDLGYFSRGTMVQEFEDVSFNMKVGQIKGPIKTNFGYHIIKLLDKKAKTIPPLDEVKKTIAKTLILDKQVSEFMSKLSSYLKEANRKEVDKLIAKYDLNWEQTGEYTLDDEVIPNIGEKPSIIRASTTLSKNKPLHNGLITDGNDSYVIFLKNIQRPQDLEDDFIKNSNQRYQNEILEKFKNEAINNSRISRNTKSIT